jgi:tetratricopeptide (TPR) repeat protein
MGMLRSVLILLLLALACEGAFAQNRKKKNKSQGIQIVSMPLSEEEKAEVDHYFIEGEKFFLLNDLKKSLSAFQKVLSIDSDNAATHYKIAQIFSDNGEMADALPYAKTAQLNQPENKYYYLLVSHIQTNLGDLVAAEETYVELLQNVKGTENYLYELAAIQLYQKKYADALESYQKAEDHFGPREEITIQRQQIYLKMNNLELALNEGRKLVEMYPNEDSYAVSLAQMMLSNDQFKEAETFLFERLDRYQNNERLYIMLSEAYSKQKKFAEAIQVLETPFKSPSLDLTRKIRTMAGYMAMLPNEALNQPLLDLSKQLVATHPGSYQVLALTGDLHYNIQERKIARDYYLKAIKIDGSNFNIWQNILSLDMELEDYSGTILHSKQALENFPNQASLYYYGGTAYLIKKEYENALKLFNIGKTYAARDPNLSSLFHGQLGDAYNSMGNHEKSDAAYEIALKSKPDNDHVLNNYSYCLSLRKKDLDKALKMSSKLVDDYPNNPTYLDTHAWVLYMRGEYGEAEKFLKRAIENEPSATIIEHYGDAMFQQGKIDEAIVQWKKSRDMVDDKTALDKKIADRQLYE